MTTTHEVGARGCGATSNAGGLGALGVGATTADGAARMIAAFRGLSSRSLNVNVFCHAPARADRAREAGWLERLAPEFARFGAEPEGESGFGAHWAGQGAPLSRAMPAGELVALLRRELLGS